MTLERKEENLIPVKELPAELERRGANRVSRSTVYRWMYRGIGGRRLRTLRIGGTHYTTWSWVLELGGPSDPRGIESNHIDVMDLFQTLTSSVTSDDSSSKAEAYLDAEDA